MPPMKATGMNTARMDRVVAMTAGPISAVPSRAAVTWSLPISACRVMFSRTTMASSMRMPMARERAIRVMAFRVKSRTFMMMKVLITDTGRVRLVMMVERQLLQEVEDDDHGEQAAQEDGHLHVVHGVVDELGVVLGLDDGDALLGQLGRQAVPGPSPRLHHGHGVAADLLLHLEGHHVLAVQAGQAALLLDAVHHGGHFLQLDGPALLVAHDHVVEVLAPGVPWRPPARRSPGWP